MIIRDGNAYGYDPGLGGFFSKAKKLVKKSVRITNAGATFTRKKIEPRIVPKKIVNFKSRAWKNPYVKAAATAVATWGVGLVAAPLIGAAAVAQAKNVKSAIDLGRGVKSYKKSKRAKRQLKLQASREKMQYLPDVPPAELARMTPTVIYQNLAKNPAFMALPENEQAQVLSNVQADAAKARTAVTALAAEDAGAKAAEAADAAVTPEADTATASSLTPLIVPAAIAAALFLL